MTPKQENTQKDNSKQNQDIKKQNPNDSKIKKTGSKTSIRSSNQDKKLKTIPRTKRPNTPTPNSPKIQSTPKSNSIVSNDFSLLNAASKDDVVIVLNEPKNSTDCNEG